MTHRQEDDATDWALLARYFAGELNGHERRSVEEWAAAHPDRAGEFEALRRLWSQAGALPSSSRVDELWHDLAVELKAAPPPVRARAHRAPASRGGAWPRRVAGLIAASLVALFGGTAAWQALSRAPTASAEGEVGRYETARGQTTNLQLTDGTQVILAPESVLEVRAFGESGPREVELTGEAVFHVTHDEARPFLVHSGHAVTEDLGTVFAVRAYPGEDRVQVLVVEGRVALRDENAPAHSGTVLEPGQEGHLDVDGQVEVVAIADVYPHLAWSQGRVVFKDARLRYVARELGRRYGVRLEIPDTSVAERRITVDIPAGPITDVVNAVAVPLDLRVERNGDLIRLYP